MEDVSNERDKKINEIISACEKNDKSLIIEKITPLVNSSRNFILTSFEFQYRKIEREGSFQLLICVGIEMLLNAIVIIESPKVYVELYRKTNKPPSFETIKKCSKRIITEGFNKKQRERMTDVLDLVQNKRNIFTHFSLGIHALYYQHYEILNVVLFLFSKYFPSQLDTILKIEEMKERFKMKNATNYDFVAFN